VVSRSGIEQYPAKPFSKEAIINYNRFMNEFSLLLDTTTDIILRSMGRIPEIADVPDVYSVTLVIPPYTNPVDMQVLKDEVRKFAEVIVFFKWGIWAELI
jgi:hypothetical protein